MQSHWNLNHDFARMQKVLFLLAVGKKKLTVACVSCKVLCNKKIIDLFGRKSQRFENYLRMNTESLV
jgi:hypothetical protein